MAREHFSRVGQAWKFKVLEIRDDQGELLEAHGDHVKCEHCGEIVRVLGDRAPWCPSCGLSPFKPVKEAKRKPGPGWERFTRHLRYGREAGCSETL